MTEVPAGRCVAALLRWGREHLTRPEAEGLLAAATTWPRTALIAWPEREVTAEAQARFAELVARRRRGEPIAYLLGQRDFRDLTLSVSPATLIPRPETELLLDWALARFPPGASLRCADLGTGSGAIALALASARPNWEIVAIEHCPAALAMAAANRVRLGIHRVMLIQGDWLASLAPGRLDLILANPPYVAAGDAHLLAGDPRFEPRSALVAGPEGLDALRAIAAALPRALAPGGWAVLEHGWNQGRAVRALLRQAGLRDMATHRDLAGHARFTTARRHFRLARNAQRISHPISHPLDSGRVSKPCPTPSPEPRVD